MKKIIYNEDNLKYEQINNIVKRAKVIFVNSKDEILLAYSHKNYYFVGGHVEKNETDKECLIREVHEETGVLLSDIELNLFFSVEYLCKDYPLENQNTNYITNYYVLNMDLIPNIKKCSLTNDEEEGQFELKWIAKEDIVEMLNNALRECTKKNVVRDTISVIKEYLK